MSKFMRRNMDATACQVNARSASGVASGATWRYHPIESGLQDCRRPSPCPMRFLEMKIRVLRPQNRWKTWNVQHRTSNAEVSEDSRCRSMFGVGCPMLDVLLASWGASFRFCARIGTMNGEARLRRALISNG